MLGVFLSPRHKVLWKYMLRENYFTEGVEKIHKGIGVAKDLMCIEISNNNLCTCVL